MHGNIKHEYDFCQAERGRFFRSGAVLMPPSAPRHCIKVTYMIPSTEIALRSFVDHNGRVPFQIWLNDLDKRAQAKIAVALRRLSLGNRSNVKGLGGGVAELKVDFGPGYRVYFGQDGETLVILLAGGSKKRQSDDIAAAKARWVEYKERQAFRHP